MVRDDERWTDRMRRRAITIPAYALGLVVVVATLPVALPVMAVIDVMRGTRLAGTRLLLFAIVFLTAEMVGLGASLIGSVASLGNAERSLAWHTRLQMAWARCLFAAAVWLFGLRVMVDDDDVVPAGPMLVLVRHASIVDTLLPTVILTHRRGIRLRFVLKRELLVDPCLDVVGHRLPNVFVRRSAIDSGREIALVRALGHDVGPGEGVILYPEGTRWTPAKQAKTMGRLREGDPARYERLRGLAHVLPPQRGGTLALLDAMPGADVLFLGHTGFDGATTLREVFAGALVGRRIHVAFWCVQAERVPRDPAERADWLDGEWLRMDAWVGRRDETGVRAGDVVAPA